MTKLHSTMNTAPALLPNATDAQRSPALTPNIEGTTAPDVTTDLKTAVAPKPPSKQDQLAALIVRDEGATLDQMVTALGWLPHTTRAALTGLKKKGFAIISDKADGVRTYRAIAPR